MRNSKKKDGLASSKFAKRVRIETLSDLGWSKSRIAKEVGCSLSTVTRWRHGGDNNNAMGEKPKRKRKIISPIKKQIVQYSKGKRKRSTRKAVKAMKLKGIDVSRESVRRTLRGAGLYPYKRQKQPRLTEYHMKKRLQFAREFKDHDWETTVMTDETDFALLDEPNRKNDIVWDEDASEVPPVGMVQKSATVKAWGGISNYGKTPLILFEGSLNAAKYEKEILEKMLPATSKIFQKAKWTFQHDGASAHKAKSVNDWLEDHVPNYIPSGPNGQWPANSPDLNPIENVWAIMKHRLEDNPPKTMTALRARVKKLWKDLTLEEIQKLANSMKRRLSAVIAKKGQFIGY
jgi:transposase